LDNFLRKEVYFSGSVQGVGFRYKSCDIASKFCITGTVENLKDGRVKLVVEGSLFEVQGFLFELRQRMIQNITNDVCEDHSYKGEFSNFKILS
jgi:acylphosphatase